uniref:Uncharacterized protein n=2 Tax=Panagrolaimus sp. JU765 TaxID=591449 RepID=A0AC34RIA6_9BILA
MGIYNDTMTPGEVIKKCRLVGAQHKRMRVQFEADNWLSVKRVVVETIMNYNGSTSKSSRLLKKITRDDSMSKLRTVWQNFVEIVVKNMKSGFLDSASYGPEFVENESVLSVDYPSTESLPYVLSTDVFL